MPKAQVGDISIYYEVKGSGYPLLMIMGLSFSLLDWEDVFIDELAKNYQVILFDNRDSGRTKSQSIDNYTTTDMANDAAGLLNALGIAQAHVFGVSMGGMIAQQFALKYATKLNKLILACTMAGGHCSDFIPDNQGNLLELLFPTSYLAISHNWEKAEVFFRKTSHYHSQEDGLTRQIQAHTTHDTCNLLQDIKASTLIITGDSDVVIPASNSIILNNRISGSQLKIIKQGGHGFIYSHTAEVAKLLTEFLA
ncbi:alpha/beta hydrolase [Nostoc sp. FACHB-152]|uniref:alpha/beta fold hydrolase n=1 Tax=unclassified Nostoc TaxID=2593658 RepID=UPI0016886BE8|nr:MULTISPECIES: alpha/beta hydrolase [unclassified Nostoc]MBD2447834.1 alpha/beta hydrolase [Nostoc sp. FACHB-152]MBD2468592.1 alpha/beta hydrolase [Nostoc sp. FACHB-145]